MDSSILPMVVVIVVAGFLLGNMFAAKPKNQELKVADFRLLARKFALHPKLVAIPDWLSDTDKSTPKPSPFAETRPAQALMAQYSMICDDWRLPLARFVIKDGVWRMLDGQGNACVLDGVSVDLPDGILPYVQGLQIKANSVMIFWQDRHYQSDSRHKLDSQRACDDLTALQASLQQWVAMVQSAK